MTGEWTTLLSGVVGSHAYGLAHSDSDVDTLAVAAAPTEDFHGLRLPVHKAASKVQTDPDVTVHEVGKYLGLCLVSNPTVTELLWLPDDCYQVSTELGDELIALRTRLVSAQYVHSAYLGYAYAQFKKLRNRGTTFSSDVAGRTEKHARHLLRLIDGGTQLYVTGHLDVRLQDPERYRAFGVEVATNPESGIQHAEELLTAAHKTIEAATSPLPQYPDETHADAWLRSVRRRLYVR